MKSTITFYSVLFYQTGVKIGLLIELLIPEFDCAPSLFRPCRAVAKVELQWTPVEVVVAALSTDSSTMEELEWGCVTRVRAFIHCPMRTTFGVCIMGS